MIRPSSPGRIGRRAAEPVELTELRGWMRNAKGSRTFDSIARRAMLAGMPISECTLRRALTPNGRLPTRHTVLAFARGADADGPTPGAIVAAGKGRFSRRDLDNTLNGRGLASEQLLIDFAAAIGAGEKATRALLDGRSRILTRLPGPVSSYPCAVFDWAEGRRQGNEAALAWRVEPELDWYDQQLRDEEEAEHRRRVAWIDSLTEAEFDELERQTRLAASVQGDLRAELAAYLERARSADEVGR